MTRWDRHALALGLSAVLFYLLTQMWILYRDSRDKRGRQ